MKWMLSFIVFFMTIVVCAQPSKEEIKKHKIKKWSEKRSGDAGDQQRSVWYDRRGNDSLHETNGEVIVIKNTYKNGRLVEKTFVDHEGKSRDKYGYQYNADGSYKETYTDASFGMKSYEWFDKKGRLMKSQSPDGNTTTYKYDTKGKLLTAISDGKNGGVKIDRRYYYNGKGQLVKVEKSVDGNKSTIKYEYDSKDRVLREIEKGSWEGDEFETETENEYNEKGLVRESRLKTKNPSTGSDSKTKYDYSYEYY